MEKKKNTSPPKKYKCITKIGNNDDGTAKCVKYSVSDLISYTNFLDKNYPTWVWTKVYSNLGHNKRDELLYYKPDSKPTKKTI